MISKKEEVLRQLRIVRKEKKMSYQNIVDALEEAGCPLAMSTVRRVFDERYRANDFKYETTLKPIVRIVLGLDEDFDDPETSALAAVVDYKDARIEQLEAELARYRQEAEEDRTDDELAFKKARKWLFGLGITVAVMSIILVALMMMLEAYIVLDLDHPEWGLLFK